MIGDYYSDKLASPRDRVTAIHNGNGSYITYALNVTTAGYFTLTLPNVVTYPGDAKAESIRLSVNGEVYDEQGWTGTATDLTFKPFYLYAGVNRITLTNLTVPFERVTAHKVKAKRWALILSRCCSTKCRASPNQLQFPVIQRLIQKFP